MIAHLPSLVLSMEISAISAPLREIFSAAKLHW